VEYQVITPGFALVLQLIFHSKSIASYIHKYTLNTVLDCADVDGLQKEVNCSTL